MNKIDLMEEVYKKEFGCNFNLGIEIPAYFEDQSYRHDTCPKFIYNYQNVELFLFVEHEKPEHRETEERRYTIEAFTFPNHIIAVLSTESQDEALNLINDRSKINKIIENIKSIKGV